MTGEPAAECRLRRPTTHTHGPPSQTRIQRRQPAPGLTGRAWRSAGRRRHAGAGWGGGGGGGGGGVKLHGGQGLVLHGRVLLRAATGPGCARARGRRRGRAASGRPGPSAEGSGPGPAQRALSRRSHGWLWPPARAGPAVHPAVRSVGERRPPGAGGGPASPRLGPACQRAGPTRTRASGGPDPAVGHGTSAALAGSTRTERYPSGSRGEPSAAPSEDPATDGRDEPACLCLLFQVGITSDTRVRSGRSSSGPAGGASESDASAGAGTSCGPGPPVDECRGRGAPSHRLGRIHPYVRSCSAATGTVTDRERSDWRPVGPESMVERPNEPLI